ncbi:methylmalonate semialdehyde dehydrogenase [acylating] [Edaphobacter acidisoli]|uniref:methylmalonate-semialdehyde dehydrogenase (CoA acylating) n=1 Tax=Edaphobacter acidisoli TaxID=2040573 RepID=A0A916RHZ8_9BACT|nr:CoA-acylating methylmalonate-semialdehyde dehydrogenase [Edaphobacter acidisoli]GGA56736.1 methylmalonate semialdehyde dehydrogenase [acylating] [Edaphobacter acidisoli]
MTPTAAATETTEIKSFIEGAWSTPKGESHSVINPANGETIATLNYSTAADVDLAARAAHKAFLSWREVPVVDRVQPLYKFKTLLEKHTDEIARLLTMENGKVLPDAMAEVKRAIQMVEVACGMPSLMMGDSLNDIAKGIDCHTIRQPIGACAGITPFNFPAMVPLWMYPFAIATGNTFLLKPSEKVPLSPTRMAELFIEAGIPEGVFQLIHGGKDVVEALIAHPLIKAISFVGSTPIARHIYKEGAAHGKRVQALGGAKNHLVVMPDADLPKAIDAILSSSFGAAGERCLAGSVLVPVGEVAEPLLKLLVEKTKALRFGDGLEAGMNVGPVISHDHRKKIIGYIEKGIAEGATPLCDGRDTIPGVNSSGSFLGPTIFDHVKPAMTIAREEIFGPVLSVIRAKDLDEAIHLVNSSDFGNTTTIYTASGKSAREYQTRIEVGMVGVNMAVAAPMAFFPFAGWKNSFFGDLHAHGKDAVYFYTEQKVLMTRWF